jgi:hypothetical protein
MKTYKTFVEQIAPLKIYSNPSGLNLKTGKEKMNDIRRLVNRPSVNNATQTGRMVYPFSAP